MRLPKENLGSLFFICSLLPFHHKNVRQQDRVRGVLPLNNLPMGAKTLKPRVSAGMQGNLPNWHPACSVARYPAREQAVCFHLRNRIAMHATQLAEIGGWLSVSSDLFIREGQHASLKSAMRYWAASKCRLQRWQAALKVFENDFANPSEMHDPWHAVETVVQEIFVSEVLTRTLTAILVQHDRASENHELQSIGHSVFIGHLEARNRALRLLLKNRSSNQAAFDRMDEMRRRMERWIDLLLSRVTDLEVAIQFGFDENRIRDFAADRTLENDEQLQQARKLLLASLSASLKRGVKSWTANPDLNREIAAGVLACVPNDRFDSIGLPKSITLMQMEQVHNDTHEMVANLIDNEDQFAMGC